MKTFRAKKALGQNFISDPHIISAIADASCTGPSDTVVEIGPGLGALTCELAERAAKVFAVELDTSVIPLLKGNLAGAQNVEIINEDILKFDWSRVVLPCIGDTPDMDDAAENIINSHATRQDAVKRKEQDSAALRIIGNLPYYITTPILLGILEKGVPAKSITAMVQKEVADRIVAKPGGKDYGVLSISLQYYADCAKVLDVPSEYFTPRPKVDSAVVHMTLKPSRLLAPEEEPQFFAVVKAAFSQRRKTLLNSLTGLRLTAQDAPEASSGSRPAAQHGAEARPAAASLTKDQVGQIIAAAGIDPQRRPETLAIEEFAALSRAFAKGADQAPAAANG